MQSLIGKSSQSVSVKSLFSGHIWAGVYSGYKWQWYLQICWGLYFWTLMGLQLQGIRLREFAQFLYCRFNASPVRPSTTTWTTILSYHWLRCEAVTADQFGPTGLFFSFNVFVLSHQVNHYQSSKYKESVAVTWETTASNRLRVGYYDDFIPMSTWHSNKQSYRRFVMFCTCVFQLLSEKSKFNFTAIWPWWWSIASIYGFTGLTTCRYNY